MKERYIVPAETAIDSFRSNGFKSTASALSEIIDNSIQAGAKNVDVILFEKETKRKTLTVWRLEEIAVLDDGCGMNKATLGTALQFGNGTRLKDDNELGLGRFGMGLPNSSASQCEHVEVYSWEAPDKVLFAELDIDKVKREHQQVYEDVVAKKLPEKKYLHPCNLKPASSGTMVVWLKCDRLDAAKGETLINRVEPDMGRTYRYFITAKKNPIKITFYVIREHQAEPRKVHVIKAEDPLYLITPNNVPGHASESTNVVFGREDKESFNGRNGRPSEVVVTYTMAKPEIQTLEGGNTAVGKHYKRNMGVSFVRAKREIDFLDFGIEDRSEPRHRWWSVEVSFPPNLDEIFGVPNTKQGVYAVQYFNPDEIKQLQKEVEKDGENWEEHLAENPTLKLNIWLSQSIRKNIDAMMAIITTRREGSKGKKSGGPSDVEAIVRDNLEKDQTPTYAKTKAEGLKPEDVQKQLISALENIDPQNAAELAKEIQENRLPIKIIYKAWPASQFMSISREGGVVILELNTSHEFIDSFVKAKEKKSFDELNAIIELMFCAYARSEDEALTVSEELDKYQEMRERWGKKLKEFIKDYHKGSQ